AQAVVSRTYALRNYDRHSEEGFNLCDTTHCQIYGGKSAEDERSNSAVDETKGEILAYEGEPINALYHGSSGGRTASPENVWGWEAPKYLTVKRIKYANQRSKDYWESTVKADFIEKRLNAAGYNVGRIKKIKKSGKTRSGRAKNIAIITKKRRGKTVIPAVKFRKLIGYWKIKSTMIKRISKKGDSFIFSGYGWGHGVGMCQTSARNMANERKSYKKILKYFYPKTDLENWK
ncbi:SpoIID/LytB domain-containing protein, partial [Elusimicrobiota bacterium]